MQVFAEALKTWREKQRLQNPTKGCKNDELTDSEVAVLETFVDATKALTARFSVYLEHFNNILSNRSLNVIDISMPVARAEH